MRQPNMETWWPFLRLYKTLPVHPQVFPLLGQVQVNRRSPPLNQTGRIKRKNKVDHQPIRRRMSRMKLQWTPISRCSVTLTDCPLGHYLYARLATDSFRIVLLIL
ncbi:hypothetical protein PHET_02661 [Paragonimus heterotremus]|uniref:Uncharacterized protein n=1 Tax=Paragonimus heterotremus TaxID=100268 RepID=A0A8J4WIG0_9TREM|nr:hypothetical protein PHET_02661 [Paragonimus heterotremus]